MHRKQTILAMLKKEILEKKETNQGFAYKFNASDGVIDQLSEFIKTERRCCDFFRFNLSIGKEADFVWLELSGPEGSKGFITTELEL
jgi:hypothetical protein